MPSNHARPAELAWAAVAWTQFLILITVVDKADMNRVWQFFTVFIHDPNSPLADSRPFGSAAPLLNVISLAWYAYPLMGWHTWGEDESYLQHYRLYARRIAVVGFFFWLLSVLLLLFFVNLIFGRVCGWFFIIAPLCLSPVSRYRQEA